MRKAVVLAAGDSTRMLPLSANRPKHLLLVAGKPLLFHTLEALMHSGIKQTLIVCGYHADQLRNVAENTLWREMSISFIHQEERKGTAHAAGLARDFVGSDDAILMYGDVLVGPGCFEGLIKLHQKRKYDLTLSVTPREDRRAYGVVTTKGERATGLVEKPFHHELGSNLVNAGIYAIGSALWEAIDKTDVSPRGEYELTDSIMVLIQRENVGTYLLPSWWLDVGRPWDLLEANRLLLTDMPEQVKGTVEEGAVIKRGAVIESGALVKSGAYIEGPVYIAEGATVGPNCYVRAHTCLGRNVKVGNAVEIKNSIIMDHTNVGHLSYVGDSVIGERSNFGAGTITANLRHDNTTVHVMVKGERVDSGRRKLGTIVGDDVKTGIGTSISPGVVLYQGARTGAGVIVDRDIPPNTLVVTKQQQKTSHLSSRE